MIELENAIVYHGSNLDVLPTLADNSVDAIVTDPPYELGFMGKSWDSSGIAYSVELWAECLRVLKPGGHLLAFSGSRTYHRMTVAIEDSGFEIRDMISWISNKTFPKSHNIQKATKSDDWTGWGTALKPTVEPIVMARKPVDGTIANNVLTWGVGGLNIDASRISTTDSFGGGAKGASGFAANYDAEGWTAGSELGRWPANVAFDEDCAELLDKQSGVSKSPKTYVRNADGFGQTSFGAGQIAGTESLNYGDSGGASRFFYVARASKQDRNEGIESNTHPTVKPTALMEYLIKLITPAGGLVLDPFAGSGSTGKAALLNGYRFIGIELTAEYLPIIKGRLEFAAQTFEQQATEKETKESETLF